MRHFAEAQRIWQAHVPARGPADSVQGELLRSVEQLRDEAQRNGNVNWGALHATMACFVRDTLVESGLFGAEARAGDPIRRGAARRRVPRDLGRFLRPPDRPGRRVVACAARAGADRRGPGFSALIA